MKFGKRFSSEVEDGWRYVNYPKLKERCKALDGELIGSPSDENIHDQVASFAEEIAFEIKEVEKFMDEQITTLRGEVNGAVEALQLAEDWIDSQYSNVDEQLEKVHSDLVTMGVQVAKLLKCLDINVTAARKIVKKYDKHMGYYTGTMLFSSGSTSLERLSDPFQFSELVKEIQNNLDREYYLRNKLARKLNPGDLTVDELNWVKRKVKRIVVNEEEDIPLKFSNASVSHERASSFEQFLSRQLLVSKKTHESLALVTDMWFERNWRQEGFQTIVVAKKQTTRTMNLDFLLIMLLVFLYQANLYSFPPFNVFFTAITRKPLYAGACCYGTVFLSSWAFLYTAADSWIRGGHTVLLLCISMLFSNIVFAAVFSPSIKLFAAQQTVYAYEGNNSMGDFGLLVSFVLLGAGAVISRVIPSVFCAQGRVAMTRSVDVVAASLVGSFFFARVFGRGFTVGAASIYYSGEKHLFGLRFFTVNGLTSTPIVFAFVWLCLLVGSVFITFVSKRYASSKIDWQASYIPAASQLSPSVIPNKFGWFLGTCFLMYSVFTQVLVQATFAVLAQMVFSLEWGWITFYMLIQACLEIPGLACGYLLSKVLHPLRACVILIIMCALSSSVLLPYGAIMYGSARYIVAQTALSFFALALEGITMSQLCSTLEDNQEAAPLFRYYGLVGPVLTTETAKFFASGLSYFVVALTLLSSNDNPTFVLNCLMSISMVLHVGMLVLLYVVQ